MFSIYLSMPILIYCLVLMAVIGAVLGSFLNCASYRIAHHESFLKGHSHCPSCGHDLGILDLFPVFSWIFLKGRCRYCQEKISVRYPLTELFFALISVLTLLKFDLSVEFLRNYVFTCCLFTLSLVDLEDMTIPDGCLIIMLIAWISTAPFLYSSWKEVILSGLSLLLYGGGLLLISLLFDKLLKKESMGGGDIKLFGVVGLYLGLVPTLFTLLLSCVTGLLFSALLKKIHTDEENHFPFGPAIALSAWIVLLYGGGFVSWYLGLLGL